MAVKRWKRVGAEAALPHMAINPNPTQQSQMGLGPTTGFVEVSAAEWARMQKAGDLTTQVGASGFTYVRPRGWKHTDNAAQVLVLSETRPDGTVVLQVVKAVV